jgi:hypothetical protein
LGWPTGCSGVDFGFEVASFGDEKPEDMCSMLTNGVTYTSEIKSRIAMVKAAFNKKTKLFASKMKLNLRKKLVKSSFWSTLCMVLKFGHFESRSKVAGKV